MAANLSGYKQQITGSDGGGIAMLLVKSVSASWEDCFALGHADLSLLLATTDERGLVLHKLALHLIYGAYVEYLAYASYVKSIYASYANFEGLNGENT
jgi:hypothetical protein